MPHIFVSLQGANEALSYCQNAEEENDVNSFGPPLGRKVEYKRNKIMNCPCFLYLIILQVELSSPEIRIQFIIKLGTKHEHLGRNSDEENFESILEHCRAARSEITIHSMNV